MMFGDVPATGRVDVSSHSQNPPNTQLMVLSHTQRHICKLEFAVIRQ